MSVKQPKKRYREGLDKQTGDRYDQKISLIGGIDPYHDLSHAKMVDDPSCLPVISYMDIINYLVTAKSPYTMEELKAYKSLEAYNQFVNGWVKDLHSLELNGRFLVTARVRHSQRMNDSCLKPWVIIDKTGVIAAAHCDCMAGLGEACSHVGATLYAVECAARISASKTVTQEKAYWMLPSSIDKVNYSEISQMDFTSAETKKRQLDCAISGSCVKKRSALKLPAVDKPTAAEMDSFKARLASSNCRSAILSVTAKYQDKFIPAVLQDGQLPEPLISLKDDRFTNMCSDELKRECVVIFGNMTVTEEQARNAELMTRNQSKCKEWHTLRMGRITASNMKSACTSSVVDPAISTVRSICGQSRFSNKATAWGCQHEEDARSRYHSIMEKTHDDFGMTRCGLFINPNYPHIGASPDALVNCLCCGSGVIEVKCPYCAKDKLLNEAHLGYLSNGKLKTNHQYFYQIQTQLLVTEKEYCDFIVWTEKDISIERIGKDNDIVGVILEKSKTFFIEVILPELTGNLISREKVQRVMRPAVHQPPTATNTAEIICICQTPYNEEIDNVVGCDNENCVYRWLHFTCVKIKKAPKGAYYCPECKSQRRKKKNLSSLKVVRCDLPDNLAIS